MAKNHTITATETAFVIEGLRKLALQRDTKAKYADDEFVLDDAVGITERETYQADIALIRDLLKKLGDTKPLVLKSERKAKKAKPAVAVVKTRKATKSKTLATA